MNEKQFSLENTKNAEGKAYKGKILRIINNIELSARVVDPDAVLHKELHEHKTIDTRKEIEEFESVRLDVCDTFGIPYDEDHIFLYDKESDSAREPKTQRALRVFFILIDVLNSEGFYGEGRIDHNTLFRNVAKLIEKKTPGMDFDKIIEILDTNPRAFLVFKGFLSTKEFREISEGSRRVLETPLHDSDGSVIKTAEDWFLTGHNLD